MFDVCSCYRRGVCAVVRLRRTSGMRAAPPARQLFVCSLHDRILQASTYQKSTGGYLTHEHAAVAHDVRQFGTGCEVLSDIAHVSRTLKLVCGNQEPSNGAGAGSHSQGK